jgi:hypothetical protein
MTIDTSRIFPERVKEMLCPGRVYDGGRREIGLTYEQIEQVMSSIKSDKPTSFGFVRTLVNEVWGFSNGKNSVDDVVKKIGFEYDLEIEGKAIMPMIEALERNGVLKLRRK